VAVTARAVNKPRGRERDSLFFQLAASARVRDGLAAGRFENLETLRRERIRMGGGAQKGACRGKKRIYQHPRKAKCPPVVSAYFCGVGVLFDPGTLFKIHVRRRQRVDVKDFGSRLKGPDRRPGRGGIKRVITLLLRKSPRGYRPHQKRGALSCHRGTC